MATRPAQSRAKAGVRSRAWPVAWVLGGLLLAYYLLPLLALLTAQPPGDVLARLGDGDVVRAAGVSLLTAAATTSVSALLGVPLAWRLARASGAWKQAASALVALPLVFPPIVSGMLLLSVFGPGSPVGALFAGAGLPLTRSLGAVVLAQTLVASPFVVLASQAAFEGVPRAYEQASRTLGKGAWTTFRRVTLPLAWPGVLAGLTLCFARAIGEFGATLMMAYYPRTMPVQIWVAFTTQGLARAFPAAAVLAGIALAVLLLLHTLGSNPFQR